MRKSLLQIAAASALLAGSLSTQAATMTLTNWKFGSGNAVNASAPVYSGGAGGFVGTLSGAVLPYDALNGAIYTYCVELTEHFGFNGVYGDYTPVSATSQFGSAKALTLGRLVSYLAAHPTAVDTAGESTSMQLAVWNTVYDTDLTLTTGGTFSDTSSYAAYANDLLSWSQSQAQTQNVYILHSDGHQDQLVWRQVRPGQDNNVEITRVPEPASLALVALALTGLVASRRGRSAE